MRFNPAEVEQRLGKSNKFKLIYPREAPGPDPDLYIKLARKANDIWRQATGTVQNTNPRRDLQKEEKPKKKKKKKKALPKEAKEANDDDNKEKTDANKDAGEES